MIKLAIDYKIYNGEITRIGFGGPWQRGKREGQLALFMIWREEWRKGEVEFAYVIWSSSDWRRSFWSKVKSLANFRRVHLL